MRPFEEYESLFGGLKALARNILKDCTDKNEEEYAEYFGRCFEACEKNLPRRELPKFFDALIEVTKEKDQLEEAKAIIKIACKLLPYDLYSEFIYRTVFSKRD